MKTTTYKLSISKNKKNNKEGIITLEGDLSLKNIKEIKEKIQKGILKFDQLEIHIKNVENIDVTLIQLLISVNQTKKLSKVNITIKEQMQNMLETAGIYNFLETANIYN
ncbi:MAG: STAS domain-containing protein [Bacteroidales bacterium]|nr:STAS domain-containing protein [Bacteroidales bacterium]